MLLAAERLTNAPVMSLQTGGQLARTRVPLIDPRNLMIVAYELEGPNLDQNPSLLLMRDVRELSNIGFIVDSSDEFVGVDDVIKVKEVWEFHFELEGKLVVDERGRRLGKVTSYAVEPGSFMIKQLNVKRPFLKSFSDTELLIDRTQIIEVSDTKITVQHDERQPAPVKQAAKVFTNPFRTHPAQPETIDRQQPPS